MENIVRGVKENYTLEWYILHSHYTMDDVYVHYFVNACFCQRLVRCLSLFYTLVLFICDMFIYCNDCIDIPHWS